MSAYDRAVGGALKLKGVGPLITKKESSGKKKEKKRAAAAAAAAAAEAAEVRRMPSARRVARIRPAPPTAGATLLRRSAHKADARSRAARAARRSALAAMWAANRTRATRSCFRQRRSASRRRKGERRLGAPTSAPRRTCCTATPHRWRRARGARRRRSWTCAPRPRRTSSVRAPHYGYRGPPACADASALFITLLQASEARRAALQTNARTRERAPR